MDGWMDGWKGEKGRKRKEARNGNKNVSEKS